VLGVRIPPGLPVLRQLLTRGKTKEESNNMFGKVGNFISEVTVELKKVSWPTKNELVGSTIVVIISVAVLSFFIGVCDFIFSKAVQFIIR
jgi:preprotein translocase subunit SecE